MKNSEQLRHYVDALSASIEAIEAIEYAKDRDLIAIMQHTMAMTFHCEEMTRIQRRIEAQEHKS